MYMLFNRPKRSSIRCKNPWPMTTRRKGGTVSKRTYCNNNDVSSYLYNPVSSHLYSPVSSHLYSPVSSHLYNPVGSHLYNPVSSHLCNPVSHQQGCPHSTLQEQWKFTDIKLQKYYCIPRIPHPHSYTSRCTEGIVGGGGGGRTWITCCGSVCRGEFWKHVMEGFNVMDVKRERIPLLWSTVRESFGPRFLF